MNRLVAWSCVSIVALAALTSPASAQDAAADERARILFEAGRVHFEAGEYERALPEFEEAFELSHRDALLYNIGVTRERLGDHAGALDALERFLATGGSVPNMPRETLEQRVEALRRRVEAERDESAQETGAESDTAIDTPPPARGDDVPIGPVVLFSVAGAALLTGVIVGGLAVAEDGRLQDLCAPACPDAELGSIRAYRVVTDVSLALSLASATAGLVWWLVDANDGEPPERASLRWSPWASAEGAGVMVGGAL